VPALQSILDVATRRAPEALALLRQWVEQNSFTGSIENVNRMGALLKRAFELPELRLEVQPGNGFGDHLAWHTPAWETAPEARIVLVGHHDTVFPPGSFEGWREEGDRVRGPGVLDMKGGIVAVWSALGALSECSELSRIPLLFVSVADEEVGSVDSRRFTARLARGARAALVFEAGRAGDAIITRRKGTGSVRVCVTGKAAHAGNQHKAGINAIWALSRFVDRAQKLTDYDRGVTVNVGVISGGTSKNTVPAQAECTLDFRIVAREDAARVEGSLQASALELEQETGAHFELDGGLRRPPLEPGEASLALFRRYGEHARAEGLGGAESALIGGGSDANDVSALGVPSIDGLGPRGRGFHTPDEYIEPQTLPQKAAALIRFLVAENA
jgi:glutamate carboxypeptidase